MGSTVSQEINAAAQAALSIVNNTQQDCVQRGTQTGNLYVACDPYACTEVNITVRDIDFNQYASYNQSCLGDVNITADLQQQINQQFAQMATAIAQQFQVSAANVNQVAEISATIADTITSETVQNCGQEVAQTENLTVECRGGVPLGQPPTGPCNVVVEGIRFDQAFVPINDCILRNTQANQVVQEVTQIIEQTGTAKIESILGPLVAIILVIIVLIGAVFIGGEKALTNWKLWVVVIVVIIIYLALAYWRRWFPFEGRS